MVFFVKKFFCFFFNKGNNICNSNTRCVKMNGISCRFQRRNGTVAVLIVPFSDFFFQQFKIRCNALFNIFLIMGYCTRQGAQHAPADAERDTRAWNQRSTQIPRQFGRTCSTW